MKKTTQIIELLIDEDAEQFGIDAISLVEHPAIESNWVAFNKGVKLAAIDEEKRMLIGAALIPNKQIYRSDDERGDYYVWFSHNTVRKASQLFLQNFKQNNTTLEHDARLQGQSVVESWIVEDTKKDKTRLYGMNVPVGTWMVSMKVENEEVWQDYVKAGKVRGFSIEGFFIDNMIEAQAEKLERRNPECSDGWEHRMPDGSWMCDRYHSGEYSGQCKCGKDKCDCGGQEQTEVTCKADEAKLQAVRNLIKRHFKAL
tara:strand:+ start:195 stop:965 length:771 start_codon:yes stop_codon:yes gene_type:complete